MTQSLHELLANVRAAEAEPIEWTKIEARVVDALANAKPTIDEDVQDATVPSPPRQGVASSLNPAGTNNWIARLGGGVAVGVAVAGLVWSTHQAAETRSESSREPTSEPMLASHPMKLDVFLPASNAERCPARFTRREARAAPPIPPEPIAERPQANIEVPPETFALGESDVEYDRRHLAPIDAALHANEPRKALQLLAAFRPRKLANYAAGLRAIALCNAGEKAQGKRLAQRTLSELTNRGLASRMSTACGLSRE